MRRAVAASGCVLGVLFAASAVFADNVIIQRKAVMKRLEDQTEVGAAMLKGQMPYDATKAAGIFASYKDALAGYAGLFPPGSQTGDTKAAAAIWSDRAGFEAAAAAFNKAAADNAPNAGTADGFKAAFSAVANTCRSCHQSYKMR